MSASDIIRTAFEIVLTGFTFWAIFNEDKLIAFEENAVCFIRRKKLKLIKGGHSDRRTAFLR